MNLRLVSDALFALGRRDPRRPFALLRRMPLGLLRVLELGQVLAGPFAGAIFADLGAEVIRVDSNHVVVNAGLKSESYIAADEFVEVTPKNLRLRKRLLREVDRRKVARAAKSAE